MFNSNWLKNFLAIQCCVTLSMALGFWMTKGREASFSALVGGIIAVLPTFIFAQLFFKINKTEPAKQVLGRFYLAEALKLLLTTLLFTLAFQWSKLNLTLLLLTFIATHAGYWFLAWSRNAIRIN